LRAERSSSNQHFAFPHKPEQVSLLFEARSWWCISPPSTPSLLLPAIFKEEFCFENNEAKGLGEGELVLLWRFQGLVDTETRESIYGPKPLRVGEGTVDIPNLFEVFKAFSYRRIRTTWKSPFEVRGRRLTGSTKYLELIHGLTHPVGRERILLAESLKQVRT